MHSSSAAWVTQIFEICCQAAEALRSVTQKTACGALTAATPGGSLEISPIGPTDKREIVPALGHTVNTNVCSI